MALATGASAEPAAARLSLGAEVASFCKIDASEQEVGTDGDIGVVAEICNSPGNYEVKARFTNLAEGVVLAGDQRAAVDEMGSATLIGSGPRRQKRSWSLQAMRRIDPSRPVIVRFSVMPL